MKRLALVILLLLANAAVAQEAEPDYRSDMPKPVVAFVERYEKCNHWAGEESYDAARGKYIDQQWKKNRCEELRPDLEKLKASYKDNNAVQTNLDKMVKDYDWLP